MAGPLGALTLTCVTGFFAMVGNEKSVGDAIPSDPSGTFVGGIGVSATIGPPLGKEMNLRGIVLLQPGV